MITRNPNYKIQEFFTGTVVLDQKYYFRATRTIENNVVTYECDRLALTMEALDALPFGDDDVDAVEYRGNSRIYDIVSNYLNLGYADKSENK